MGASGFPIDLVLFGMIAAFLVLRLRSIWASGQVSSGRRRRCSQPLRAGAGPIIEAKAEPAAPAAAQTVPGCGVADRAGTGADARDRPEFRSRPVSGRRGSGVSDDRRRFRRGRSGDAAVAAGGRDLCGVRAGDQRA